MKLYEIVDEKNRIMEFKWTTEPTAKSVQTHEISYLGVRRIYEDKLGEVMGFDSEMYCRNICDNFHIIPFDSGVLEYCSKHDKNIEELVRGKLK